MNDAYRFVGIDFTYYENEVVVVDDAQFFRMGHLSARERNCKTANQALDPTTGLNFYTAEPGGNLLGWASFLIRWKGSGDGRCRDASLDVSWWVFGALQSRCNCGSRSWPLARSLPYFPGRMF